MMTSWAILMSILACVRLLKHENFYFDSRMGTFKAINMYHIIEKDKTGI